MVGKKEERRTQQRLPLQGYMVVIEQACGGPLKNISNGGFAFYTAPKDSCVRTRTVVSGTIIGDDFYMSDLPFETISESINGQGRRSVKRHGVKFGRLSDSQASQLADFISRRNRQATGLI